MMDRCYRENAANYKSYGGRGISVCDEWHDIENFKSWAEKNGYRKGLTLDRIEVNGNYEPSNCRWTTMKTQDNNRRNTVYIQFNGEIHTITEWSEITGIKRSTLNNRYCKGFSVEKILFKGNLQFNPVTGESNYTRVRADIKEGFEITRVDGKPIDYEVLGKQYGLCYCDMEGFAITENGDLMLLDECGKWAYMDRGEYQITMEGGGRDEYRCHPEFFQINHPKE